MSLRNTSTAGTPGALSVVKEDLRAALQLEDEKDQAVAKASGIIFLVMTAAGIPQRERNLQGTDGACVALRAAVNLLDRAVQCGTDSAIALGREFAECDRLRTAREIVAAVIEGWPNGTPTTSEAINALWAAHDELEKAAPA